MSRPVIECTDLTKRFGNLTAVDHVSFEVEEGEIFGLLGPNGAGKTTTVRMLTTVIPPDEGTARVSGFDVRRKPDKVRERIGVVLQGLALEFFSTVYDTLDIYGRIYRMNARDRKERIEYLLSEFELKDKRDERIDCLSGGLQRRVQVATAFMHPPEILFLDEPTLGLDPQSRRKIWQFIEEFSKGGHTVVLSTHYMDEADYLCSRIGIIDHGKIIAIDTPEALKERFGGGDIITFDVEGDVDLLKSTISSLDYVEEIMASEELAVRVENADEALFKLSEEVVKGGAKIKNISIRKPSLEDTFIKLTGRRIE
jgi:ABC-2 type transport system ATP-binding protein